MLACCNIIFLPCPRFLHLSFFFFLPFLRSLLYRRVFKSQLPNAERTNMEVYCMIYPDTLAVNNANDNILHIYSSRNFPFYSSSLPFFFFSEILHMINIVMKNCLNFCPNKNTWKILITRKRESIFSKSLNMKLQNTRNFCLKSFLYPALFSKTF